MIATKALQIADGDRTTLTRQQETEYLQRTADGRAVAHAVAETRGKQQRHPAYIKLKFAPPAEGLRKMPARTAVEMGEVWGGTLWAYTYDGDHDEIYVKTTLSSMSLSSLGCVASLACVSKGEAYGDTIITIVGEDNATIRTMVGAWCDPACPFNRFAVYAIAAAAPGDSDVAYVVNGYHMYEIPGQPTDYVWDGPTDITAAVQLSVAGLYLKRSRTATSYDDRQTMDWSDLSSVDTWYADETTTVTVTVSGDASVSASGSLGYTPGEESEIGSSYILSAAIGMNNAPTASTPYARISNINWGGTPINAVPDLYNPGSAGGIPSADISPWSRIWTTNAAYHVFGDSGGFAIEHLSGTGSAGSIACKWSAPRILTLTAVDKMFDSQGDQYDPRIEYSSVFEDWDYVGGTWTATPHTFTDTYSVFESPTNYEYEYEYEKLSSSAVSVRVTDDWRTANGEDVAGTAEGSDNERYNDQLAGICLPPIDATDCVGDPWWLSGIGITHQAELDLNDTEGQAKRASV